MIHSCPFGPAKIDDVYARDFPGSLSGAVLKWIHKLPPNSIDCWKYTMDLFMDKFGACIVADEDEKTLMNLKQKPGEILRTYANRFQKVLTNIPTMDKKVSMILFIYGLQFGPLKERLVLEPVSNVNQLFQLTMKYIKLEEVKKAPEGAIEIQPRIEPQRSPRKRPVWDRLEINPKKKQRGRSSRRDNERIRRPQEPIYTSYTPWSTMIVLEINGY
ncbi:hypothetical protein LIER_02093 [Lithospermum erythrorhizon]|uniref:Retrotransposon gag domain-containing protein n=1 Tax=Lithospermum erythrorhizon TaxID=34254 RepID=A0AAV3NNW7_LITER